MMRFIGELKEATLSPLNDWRQEQDPRSIVFHGVLVRKRKTSVECVLLLLLELHVTPT